MWYTRRRVRPGRTPWPNPLAAPAQKVVFVMRQRHDTVEAGQRVASPAHPFYLVYVQDDGQISYGCSNTRQVSEA